MSASLGARDAWRKLIQRSLEEREHPGDRRRDAVERSADRLKQYRGLVSRYAKRAVDCRAMAVVASLVIRLGR